ncbi:DUF4286 family protein [Mycobacterium aquaticum]|uniref:EthD domain-containing protein n=1 Tax=Mycobacterium aquaticum TaxID=1927124 RepID=A0A1X0BAB3_9MYCO|nr:DUF4286 family protein [Mycobacterium aquaticum]ORA39244.1 hypothetical protein BST13_02985 [Mycobacterium aquaticum]
MNLTPDGRAVEDAFNRWYTDVHVPDYVAMAGFRAGHRLQLIHVAAQEGEPEHEYLAVYEVDAIQTFNAALASGPPWGPWQDDIARLAQDWERTYYRRRSTTLGAVGRGAVWVIVKTDLDTGADVEAFNTWYDSVHVPEITANPGVHRAWRLEVAPDANDLGPHRQRFWAVYEVDTPEDFAAARQRRFDRGVQPWDGLWTDAVRNVQIAFYSHTVEIHHAIPQLAEKEI